MAKKITSLQMLLMATGQVSQKSKKPKRTKIEKLLIESGKKNPLSEVDERAILKRTILKMRESAERRGDSKVLENLAGDVDEIVNKIIQARKS